MLLITSITWASLLDFSYLNEAKEAYKDKNYSKAQNLYGKIDNNEAKFNQADSLYRQKKYQEAIDLYNTINEPKLEAKKLHNIGNSYAQMKKFDDAIKSYKKALEISSDSDTKFNLDLLKKKKEEKKKKEKKNKDNKKDKKESDDKKNQKDKEENKKNQEKKESNNKKSQEEKKKKEEEQKKKDKKAQEKEKKQKEKQGKMGEENKTQPPISNMEERKWQKMLNQRGVKTLMIPLNKGDKHNETTPW